MRELETFKRNLRERKARRDQLDYAKAINELTIPSVSRYTLDVPPEYIQQYYIDGFCLFYAERLQGAMTLSRAQVDALIRQHLYERYNDFIGNCQAIINSDTKWKPELVSDESFHQIRLGSTTIVSFSY